MELNSEIDCCGCGVCNVVCTHKNIIRVSEARKGEIFIKGPDCIQCGRCDSNCPIKNDYRHEKQKFFFQAKSYSDETLKASSSGGVAHELAKVIIEAGGVVYGSAWNISHQRVEHQRADRLDKISIFQGSKYVQSIIPFETYKQIQADVNCRTVLFIGTPCEVAAVRSLTRDHANLLTIDLICHGVPSPEIFHDQLKMFTNKPVKSISFRNRLQFRIKVEDADNVYECPWEDNPYYSLYMHFASLREYCYRCKFACNERVGDITLGDYIENSQGYSCVIVNSNKGSEIIKKIQNRVELNEKEIGLLLNNQAFNHPTVKHPQTDDFSKLYEEYGLYKAYDRTFRKFIIKRKFRLLLGDSIYNFFKSFYRR